MPIILDPKKIKKSSKELYNELLKLPKDSAIREKKYREYLTMNFHESGYDLPEFDEKIETPTKSVINPLYIENVETIKCWEYFPYEKELRREGRPSRGELIETEKEDRREIEKKKKKVPPPVNIEGWDVCTIQDKMGKSITVNGVAHIIIDDDVGEKYSIDELISNDDMFKVKFTGLADVYLNYIKKTTSKGDVGIYTDLDIGHFNSIRELLTVTPQKLKEKLEKKGFTKDNIIDIMGERTELFKSGKPQLLRKYVTAIKKGDPRKL